MTHLPPMFFPPIHPRMANGPLKGLQAAAFLEFRGHLTCLWLTSPSGPACSNINLFSILDHIYIVLSSILHLFSIDYEVGLCPLVFMLGMLFFSLLSPHLRSPRSRGFLKLASQKPQYSLKKTLKTPHSPRGVC